MNQRMIAIGGVKIEGNVHRPRLSYPPKNISLGFVSFLNYEFLEIIL